MELNIRMVLAHAARREIRPRGSWMSPVGLVQEEGFLGVAGR